VAHRAAKIGVGLVAVALGAGVGGWLPGAEPEPAPPRPPVSVPIPIPELPAVRPFPEFDPSASTPLPTPRPAVAAQKPQPPDAPEAPTRPGVPGSFDEPPIAPRTQETPGAPTPDNARINRTTAPTQRIKFGPRYSTLPSWKLLPSDDTNTQKLLYSGGVIVGVNYLGGDGKSVQEVEFSADYVVAYIPSNKKPAPSADLNAPIQGAGEKSGVEFYLAGAVVIRQFTVDPVGGRNLDQVFSAPEIYYDVSNNKSVAVDALLKFKTPALAEEIAVRGRVLHQLGPDEIELFGSDLNGSRRPSDPGLQFTASRSVFTREERVRRNIFGIEYTDLSTGQKDFGFEQILTSYNVTPRAFNVPFFYLPRTRNDINEPFGPLAGFNIGNDVIKGFQVYTTFDVFKLAGLRGRSGDRWVVFADYLSLRGGATGTEYDYSGRDLFGTARRTGREEYNQPYSGFLRAYYLQDTRKNNVLNPRRETDSLGGDRGDEPIPPQYRGRLQWRHNQDVYENGTTYLRVMAQVEHLSDKNFLEQFFKQEFDQQPNQETFAYAQAGAGNAYASGLLEQRFDRPWVTETNWRRADGALVGQSLFDFLTYSARASVGSAELRPATIDPQPVVVTDRPINTGRFDLNQRVTAPFDLGPIRFAPYGVVDLTYYTDDLSASNGGLTRFQAGRGNNLPLVLGPVADTNGEGRGRFYGGGGLTAQATASRLYATASSELFNVNGLYHKVTARGNYFSGYSNVPYYNLPQLDRLDDDNIDLANRISRPRQGGVIQTPDATALAISPLFDPQQYAIRRLLENKVDTLDTVQVAQAGLNQRLQTKRGFPGAQHVVDWMSLDVGGTYFPDPARDNFGQSFGLLDYDYVWNFGDRVAFASSGWFDPISGGPKYYNLGLNFNRPDGTNFFVSYRQADPLGSKSLQLSLSYQLNSKYNVNFLSIYDFGLKQSLANQVNFTRIGADMTLLFGFSYNPIVQNFGVQFAIVPNLAGIGGRLGQAPILNTQR